MKISSTPPTPPTVQNTNFRRPSRDRDRSIRNIRILTYFLQQQNRNLENDATQLDGLLESQLARLEYLRSRLAENS